MRVAYARQSEAAASPRSAFPSVYVRLKSGLLGSKVDANDEIGWKLYVRFFYPQLVADISVF